MMIIKKSRNEKEDEDAELSPLPVRQRTVNGKAALSSLRANALNYRNFLRKK